MAGALADGYATATTDAGGPGNSVLIAPGVIDYNSIRNFAHRSLGEEAVIAKEVIQSFYGQKPLYSYWNGCSQGGRQGLSLAQNYPDAYNGISAAAPGLYAPQLAPTMYWPQQHMNNIKAYPRMCEVDAIVLASVAFCDPKDGITDGLISDLDSCDFDPFTMVGKVTTCNNASVVISASAASVVRATWDGITSAAGVKLWHGYAPGADVTGQIYPLFNTAGVVATNCTAGPCRGASTGLGADWFQNYLAKDTSFNVTAMTQEEFEKLYQEGIDEFTSTSATANTDLSAFRDAGGKLITFHGLADAAIPEEGTRKYYTDVSERFPDVYDFYRYFPIPGLGHCMGGQGGQPTSLFGQLRAWVENGTAPTSLTVSFPGTNGTGFERVLCPYPRKARFQSACGDSNKASCWSCNTCVGI
ncbi:uncharacterized protein CTRU02_206873 [Colletotrichum truncatum]|uniref:Uncharacterized protein n=1 Tax=Colletotrichum truncatum TaxID=5467 RepID=A0ACC3YZT0_COLTU|nr:uncharacterized protein CTRU02_14853 [Colletotrichum truncatum]KAF6781756.1 hypothetical protein CTRU02_14853 [Colletotrichum truncatum]